jgi:hypothetical protein
MAYGMSDPHAQAATQAAPDGQLASELADVLEVLKALAAVHDMGWEDVVSEASRKRAERGGFDQRIFLEYVDQARLPAWHTQRCPGIHDWPAGGLPRRVRA